MDLPAAEEGREGKRPCAVPGPGVVSVARVAASDCGRTSCCWGVPAAAQAALLGCGKEAFPGGRDGGGERPRLVRPPLGALVPLVPVVPPLPGQAHSSW